VNLFRVQNAMDQAASRFLAFQIRPPSTLQTNNFVAMPVPILGSCSMMSPLNDYLSPELKCSESACVKWGHVAEETGDGGRRRSF
jgi:hypothetical protein